MKKLLLLSLLTLTATAYADTETQQTPKNTDSTVTDTTKSVVSGIVKFSKDLLDGADKGVDEGRKVGQSQDGAIIIDNGGDLAKYLTLKILKIKAVKDNKEQAAIVVGFKNANDKPVRVINLRQAENVIVIDNDGYASDTVRSKNYDEFTIPSKAGKKQTFYFELEPSAVKEIRIMGQVLTKK